MMRLVENVWAESLATSIGARETDYNMVGKPARRQGATKPWRQPRHYNVVGTLLSDTSGSHSYSGRRS